MTKAYKGMAMEGTIARWYAKNTRQGRDFDVLAKRVSQIVPAGGRILEVAPGPGFLSIEIAKLGQYQVSGVDISKTFVQIEQANAKEAGVEIDFRQGDAAIGADFRKNGGEERTTSLFWHVSKGAWLDLTV